LTDSAGKSGFWLTSLLRRLRSTAELFSQLQKKRIFDAESFQSRDRFSLAVTASVFAAIAVYLVLIGWQREHTDAYLLTKKNIVSFDSDKRTWFVSHMPLSKCLTVESCYEQLRNNEFKEQPFKHLTDPARSADKNYNEPTMYLVRTRISNVERSQISSDYLAVGMPNANFEKAYSFVNGKFAGTYLLSSRVGINFYLPKENNDDITVDVLYESDGSGAALFLADDEEPLLLTKASEYRGWIRMLIMQDARQGSWLTDMSFIVMAALFLMIFLFVDSSPEVLGLGLFMGFEALSRSLDYGWLPISRTYALEVFLSGASHAMRVYYVVQLCRLGPPSPRRWILGSLGYGLLISAGSWLRQSGIEFTEDYSEIISASLNLILSIAGVVLLLSTAYFLRGKNLAWRQWALMTAALACLMQSLGGLDVLIPDLGAYKSYYQIRSVFLPLSTYLLAASAFINISSLENRVRTLSSLQTRSDQIEKELELGRLVQGAFMRVPELPENIDLAHFFEAAFYVSGDAYYIEWDEDRSRLVVILGDMTGHGVQAALKSTSMQTVARSFFRGKRRSKPEVGARFEGYYQSLGQLFAEAWGPNEVPTFIAAEIDVSTGLTSIFRSNFPFALVIKSLGPGQWTVASVSERTRHKSQLAEGEFVVFASDGIFEGSRLTLAIRKEIETVLAGVSAPSAEAVKGIILKVVNRRRRHEKDDQSMLVFGVKKYSKQKNGKDFVA
jgi:hypothetical protein